MANITSETYYSSAKSGYTYVYGSTSTKISSYIAYKISTSGSQKTLSWEVGWKQNNVRLDFSADKSYSYSVRGVSDSGKWCVNHSQTAATTRWHIIKTGSKVYDFASNQTAKSVSMKVTATMSGISGVSYTADTSKTISISAPTYYTIKRTDGTGTLTNLKWKDTAFSLGTPRAKAKATTNYTFTLSDYPSGSNTLTSTKTTTYTANGWKSSGGTSYGNGASYTTNASESFTGQYSSSASTTKITIPTSCKTTKNPTYITKNITLTLNKVHADGSLVEENNKTITVSIKTNKSTYTYAGYTNGTANYKKGTAYALSSNIKVSPYFTTTTVAFDDSTPIGSVITGYETYDNGKYKLVGWKNGDTIISLSAGISTLNTLSNLTLTAIYQENAPGTKDLIFRIGDEFKTITLSDYNNEIISFPSRQNGSVVTTSIKLNDEIKVKDAFTFDYLEIDNSNTQHTFKSWTLINGIHEISEDTEEKSYTINYHNGSTIETKTTTENDYSINEKLSDDEHNIFIGWSTEENATRGDEIKEYTFSPYENTTLDLYSVWENTSAGLFINYLDAWRKVIPYIVVEENNELAWKEIIAIHMVEEDNGTKDWKQIL